MSETLNVSCAALMWNGTSFVWSFSLDLQLHFGFFLPPDLYHDKPLLSMHRFLMREPLPAGGSSTLLLVCMTSYDN